MSIWLLTAIYVPLKSRRFSLLILNCIIISSLNSSFCRCVYVCVYVCSCVRVCMYGLCMHAHVHVCAYACVCTRWRPEVDSGCLFLFIFWDRVCHWAYLSWIVWLASRSSRGCLSLAHHHWGFRPVQSCLTFAWVVGSELRFSCLCSKALYLLRKPSPQSTALHPHQSALELPLNV